MAAKAIACASCSRPLPGELWNRLDEARCSFCKHRIIAAVFPAVDRTRASVGAGATALQSESEASCFYHPQSRAVIVCEQCGSFLCALCDLDVGGRHVCPRCFESAVTVEPRRVMYDSIALAVATVPALLFWPVVIGAPWSLFLVVRHWNAPSSIVPRTKIRFVLAALIALSEVGFLIFVIYLLTQVNLKDRRQ